MSQQYETKIASLEQELRDVKESVSDKDALISEQREKIKEMQAKQAYGQKMNALKDEIMDSMESGFESLRLANKQKRKSGMDDEKIMELMDKQEEILTKFTQLQKYAKESKQYYAQIEEGMDSMK